MYHRISNTRYADDLQQFKRHIAKLKEEYPIIRPGEMPAGRDAVCLTFDDAYVDFYNDVFPILKTLNIPATLAVPVKYILQTTDVPMATRLAVSPDNAMDDEVWPKLAPFCTWDEIRTMVDSGLVTIANHTYSHANLTHDFDFEKEIIKSNAILEQQTGSSVTTFVYPYGKMTRALQKRLRKHFTYIMRIGSAINHRFGTLWGSIYRIDAEHVWPSGDVPTALQLSKWRRKYYWNLLRMK